MNMGVYLGVMCFFFPLHMAEVVATATSLAGSGKSVKIEGNSVLLRSHVFLSEW